MVSVGSSAVLGQNADRTDRFQEAQGRESWQDLGRRMPGSEVVKKNVLNSKFYSRRPMYIFTRSDLLFQRINSLQMWES